ncbi:hypothetical protein JCM19239_7837 [Vibrio variabilis]|uniref:Uncharacterized protein n=1 Tax=Vibrio variabilis TaxID=990271 RepID=A0ABQ0JMJ7_9VIBR|nr:hypothetical protein JCM19239_7837 [Vibrio variabilis]
MAAPLAVFVKPALAGAIVGGMGVVGGNPNAGFRAIAIGAFSGAVAGVLTPIWA